MCKLFVLDRNTRNHIIAYKLIALDENNQSKSYNVQIICIR